MKRLIVAAVVAAACLFVQPAVVNARCCVRRAPMRRAISFFRTRKPVRRAVKAVVTAPVRAVRGRRCCRI